MSVRRTSPAPTILALLLSATLGALPAPLAAQTTAGAAPPTRTFTLSVEHAWAQDEFGLSELFVSSVFGRYEHRLRGPLRRLSLGGELGVHRTGGDVQYLFDPRTYGSSATGFSTLAFARLYAFDTRRVDVFAEGSAGFVKFGEPFPPNGTVINGMLRYAAGVRVGVTGRVALEGGYRHTHVSNGMGLVPLNPSFDGHGVFGGVVVGWR